MASFGECLVVLQNLTCAVGDVVRLTKTGNKNCSREWGALKVDYETNIGSRTRSRQCNLESEAKRARTNLDNAPSTASSSLLSSASEEDSVKVEIGGTGQMVFLQEKSESSKCRESPLDACAHLSDSLATPPGPLVSKRRKNRRYHGPNPRLRKYFGSYKHFDKSPRSLLRFRAEGAREDRLFKNPNPELMPKPSNRYVALTAAQKRMQCKKDHRGAWVNAGHVDLRKHAMLNCLSGKFYEIKKEYDEMQKSLGVGDGDGGEEEAVPLTLDQCIAEEILTAHPEFSWREMRIGAYMRYMSPGGKGYERKREKKELKKSLKDEKKRKAMEEASNVLDFDPEMFLSATGLNKFKV